MTIKEKLMKIFKRKKKEKEFGREINGKEKEFTEMSNKEKKKFFSNDLIGRMIRVEQSVSVHFGKHVPYNKTDYYKNLLEGEKKNFEKYLKKKGRKKFLLSLVLILPLILFFIFKSEFTGQVVKENLGVESLSWLNGLFVLVFLIAIFIVLIIFVSNKTKEKRFGKHLEILDNLLLRRYSTKRGI